jgi:hypothetical protein
MPFPVSLNGKLELKSFMAGNVTPESMRDKIVSSFTSIQGCSVRTDELNILFTCAWWSIFRRGWSVLAKLSGGKISFYPKGSSLVVEYELSIIQSFVMNAVVGGLLFLLIGVNIKNEITTSSFVTPILVLLWFLLLIVDYIQIAMGFRRFLKRCAREVSEQRNDAANKK